jgi:hypothetical protein
MGEETDGEAREAAVRAGLAPLHFLLGDWEGAGSSHGEPATGSLVARLTLADTFLEVTEQHFDAAGQADHADRTVYHYDPREGRLKVHHFMVPAWVVERVVLPFDDEPGVGWGAGPFDPRVELRPDGPDRLRVDVLMPFTAGPTVTMRYRRRGAPTG